MSAARSLPLTASRPVGLARVAALVRADETIAARGAMLGRTLAELDLARRRAEQLGEELASTLDEIDSLCGAIAIIRGAIDLARARRHALREEGAR